MYKVLVVEDEAIIRQGLIYAFDWAANDCVVVAEAENGLEGLAKIKALKPDIVIADITMPVMGGLEMLEKAPEDHCFAAIILSGYDEFELARTAIRLGVSEYLLKPLEFEALAGAIAHGKESLQQRRMYAEAKGRQAPDILASLLPPSGGNISSKKVLAMLEYIHANYAGKVSLADMAEEIGASASFLSQRFKSQTGYTFNDYLNRYRIAQAVRLIQSEDLPVYQIAEMVGYSDYKYFISVFKKYVEISPRRFAQQIHG